MHKIAKGVAFAAVALALCGPAYADDPDQTMPATVGIIKTGILAKFVSHGTFALPSVKPVTNAMPNTVQFFDTTFRVNGSNTYSLTTGTWKCLGSGCANGVKYIGTHTGSDPCNVVLIKPAVVKAVCKGSGVTITTPFSSPFNLGARITTGPLGSQKTYCILMGGTLIKNLPAIFKRTNSTAPGTCPTTPLPPTTSTSSSTSSSSTSTSTSTSTSSTIACCGAERISLVSSQGTLRVDSLAPFFFPAGVSTVIDSQASDTGLPTCHHSVLVPAGGFSVPHFDIGALNYCAEIITLGCESGGKDGKGNLWDGNGSTGANNDVAKRADTSDGTCDTSFTGGNCNTTPGGSGANTLGKIVTTHPGSNLTGIRSVLDIKVKSITWSDSVCQPATNPGCCAGSNYGDDTVGNGELKITEFDFILSPTTDSASGAFTDLNSDGCKRAGSGYYAPGVDGPKILHGTPPAGPCCTMGQSTNLVAAGSGFSGGAPLFDLGFVSTIPSTVASCGSPSGGFCVTTTDPCLGSPSGAFLDSLD